MVLTYGNHKAEITANNIVKLSREIDRSCELVEIKTQTDVRITAGQIDLHRPAGAKNRKKRTNSRNAFIGELGRVNNSSAATQIQSKVFLQHEFKTCGADQTPAAANRVIVEAAGEFILNL